MAAAIIEEKNPTEEEKKIFEMEVEKRIDKIKFSIGIKTSTALKFLLVEKFKTGKKINELASECQQYMQQKFPKYLVINGERFLNELEMDFEHDARKEKSIPEDIFYNGHPIENYYEMLEREIFHKK